MARHEVNVTIERSAADVWQFVSDLSATPRWRTTVTSVSAPDELAVGRVFAATTRVLGRSWSWRLRITEVQSERRLGYEVVEGIVDLSVEYRLEPDDRGGCLFTLVGESQPRSFLTRLLDRPGAWNLRRETADHLSNLKRIMESHDEPA